MSPRRLVRRSRQVARRVVEEAGLFELRRLRERVGSLEEAVRENAALERDLDAQLGELERRLAGLLRDRRP